MLNHYKRFGIIIDEDYPYDYDTFLKHNNLSATDETYRKFVNYTDTILETLPFDMQYTYEDYQNSLYERLNDSLDYRDLVSELQKIGFGDVIDVVNSKSSVAKNFTIEKQYINIKDNPMFISLLSYYNYYINAIGEDYMQFAPYKPQDATSHIYDILNGIIYHICTKQQLKRIKKYGLTPRNVISDNVYRPYRRFYIASTSKKTIYNELKMLSHGLIRGLNRRNSNKHYNVNESDIVFLKVDLGKSSRKFRFFHDDSASGYDAFFTEETIPPYCITVLDNLKDILD